MKTDHDLLWELLRYGFESAGASKQKVDLEIARLKAQATQLKWKPPTPLSDADYAAKLEEMKKETPAFLDYLLNQKFPPIPPEFTGERN